MVAGTLPAVASLFAVLALGERPSRALLASSALASAGVLAIALPEALGAARGEGARVLIGHALVLGAVACEATFILVSKRLRVPVPPLAVWAAVYYALVPGVLGFWLWFAGSQRLAGAQASLMTAVMPVSALALAVLVLGERVSAWQVGGCALVLLAVLAVAVPPRTRL